MQSPHEERRGKWGELQFQRRGKGDTNTVNAVKEIESALATTRLVRLEDIRTAMRTAESSYVFTHKGLADTDFPNTEHTNSWCGGNFLQIERQKRYMASIGHRAVHNL